MVAKLKSASINQTLQLGLRVFAVALIALWARAEGASPWIGGLFLLSYVFSYARVPLNAKKFLASAILLGALVFLVPGINSSPGIIFISVWGVLYFLLLNIKNLVIVKRQEVYRFLHLILIAFVNILLFLNFGILSQIILFVFYGFFFKEFYSYLTDGESAHISVLAVVESFLAIQFAWIVSFLSINFIAEAALLTAGTYIFHDTALHHLWGTITDKVRIRNWAVFGVLAVVILLLS